MNKLANCRMDWKGRKKATTKPAGELELENKIDCFICSSQNVRFFKSGGGMEQHFRTVHKEKWTDEVQKKCK